MTDVDIDAVNKIKSIIDNYLASKWPSEPFNSGVLAYRIKDEFDKGIYNNQQYLHLGKWARTRPFLRFSLQALFQGSILKPSGRGIVR